MNLVEKVRELEMALCHANGKLNSIQDACEQEKDRWEENWENKKPWTHNVEVMEEYEENNPDASEDEYYEFLDQLQKTPEGEYWEAARGRADFAKHILNYLEEEE